MNRPRLSLEQAQAVEPNTTPIPNYSVDEMFDGTSGASVGQHSIFMLLCRHSFEGLKPCVLTDEELLSKAGPGISSVDDVRGAINLYQRNGYIHVYTTANGRSIIPDHYADIIPTPVST